MNDLKKTKRNLLGVMKFVNRINESVKQGINNSIEKGIINKEEKQIATEAIQKIEKNLIKINKRFRKSVNNFTQEDIDDSIKEALIEKEYTEFRTKMLEAEKFKKTDGLELAKQTLRAYADFESAIYLVSEKLIVSNPQKREK